MHYLLKRLAFVIIIFITVTYCMATETETLLDTYADNEGKWLGWSPNLVDGLGWVSSNSPMVDGRITYSVCQIDYSGNGSAVFFLRSPYIDTRDAKQVMVELRFTTRSCSQFPRPESLKRCKETLELMALQLDTPAANEIGLSDTNFYKVSTVAASVIFTSMPSSDGLQRTINTNKYIVPITKRGLYIGLRDTGSCMAMLQIRVYFLYCPRLVRNLAEYSRTPASDNLIRVPGACVANSDLKPGASQPGLICQANGIWFASDESMDDFCRCSPGFSVESNATACQPCRIGSFKPNSGNAACQPCPANSQSASQAAAVCPCLAGYFRNTATDGPETACTKPPSAPRDASVIENSQSRVVLNWSPPENTGGRNDTRYNVQCVDCDAALSGKLIFEPSKTLTDRHVTIRGLQPLTTYNFKIFAINGVSEVAMATQLAWKSVTFRTGAAAPSRPSSITVKIESGTSVRVSWSSSDLGGGVIDEYEIKIFPQLEPTKTIFYFSRVEQYLIDKLTQGVTYLLQIRARNAYGWGEYSDAVSINTVVPSRPPSRPSSITVKIESGTSARVSWPSSDLGGGVIDEYEIKIFPQLEPTKTIFYFSRVHEYFIDKLTQGVTYLLQIRARNAYGWGEYSDAVSINTVVPSRPEISGVSGVGVTSDSGGGGGGASGGGGGANANVNIIIGAVVAVLLCLVIVLTMIILTSRRGQFLPLGRKLMTGEKATNGGANSGAACSALDCNMLPYSNSICSLAYTSSRAHLPMGLQLPQHFKSYVDPHTYEDPSLALQEFAKEIDASWIAIDCVLGGGEFGDVCKGLLTVPGREPQTVAVKTLKPGASDKNKLDFLTEASIMGQFDDPNVIYLEGVVTRSHPNMIVTEFMANGSLDAFLRAHDGQLSCHQLVGMLRGVCSGMRYLSDLGYIHRDLAARNILVSQQLICKVSDFGLSREVEIDSGVGGGGAGVGDGGGGGMCGTYTTRGGKIPIRWTAPEAIHFRKFTSATDVWSFGIVMWEVMSFGERPYWNWTNQDVIAAVENGYRLPPPMDCPESVHQLMLDCWKWDRTERPKFAVLVRALDRLLHQPELLTCQRSRPIYEPPTQQTMPTRRYASLRQWLSSLRLERYSDAFYQSGVHSMDQVPRLTSNDLSAMGIASAAHQKRLLGAIEKLQLHVYEATPYSDGYLV